MRTNHGLLPALALTLSPTGAKAITFTSNTAIGVGNTNYDGQEITHSPAPNGEASNRLDLTIAGDVTVAASSAIQADGRGYGSGRGPGTVPEQIYQGAGAGHGGNGGGTSGGWDGGGAYGSVLEPTMLGSGGGVGSGAPGGAGGGVIRLVVGGVLWVDGQLTANGANGSSGWYGGGGGSGGSVWLTVGTLVGAGIISANGGQGLGTDNRGGGGGGGRLALYYGTSTFSGQVTAWGGNGYQRGGAGTVFRKPASEPLGELLIDVAGGTSWRNWGWPGSLYLSTNMLPLWVSSFRPTGTVRQAVSSVDVVFNQPVRSETFTPEDVLITVPSGEVPHGEVTVTPLSAASFRVGFRLQAALGTYLVQIGPHIENLYGQEMAEAYVGSFTITNPVISGFVKRTSGVALPNVLLSTGPLSTTTDTNGASALAVPPSWSGTIAPTNAGWVFTPGSLSYVSLTADATNQNFTASLAEPLVLTTTRSANSLQFRWPSALGLEYQLQSATILPATSWLDEGAPFAGTGSVLSTNLSIGPEPAKFYRVRVGN
jgi:hypothetical protein